MQERAVETAIVRFVADGDTIETDIGRVRVIGIDAPEYGECYSDEARAELHRLAGRKSVTLISEPLQGDRDKYGRLLRYVELEGRDIGAKLLEGGFVRLFPPALRSSKSEGGWFPFERMSMYEDLASEAKERERGLWRACE